MKALAILCAIANLAAVAFVSFLLWFVASFPWENTTPEEAAADDWMIPVAFVLAAAAAGLLLCVVRSWQGWALGAFGLQTIIVVGILAFALGASDHSDGTFLAMAMVVGTECAGGAAVWFLRMHLPARRPAF